MLGWAPEGVALDKLAGLKEWAEDVEAPKDGEEAINFLMENRTRKILTVVPGFTYFGGQGLWKNRHDLHIGWAPDNQRALAIYEARWDDESMVWIETTPVSITKVYEPMCAAYRGILRTKEKQKNDVAIQFIEPAILPGNVLVVDACASIPKDGPSYHYRLRFRVEGKGPKVRMTLVKSQKIPKSEERTTGVDYEPDLNAAYQKLKAKLPAKEFAQLKAGQIGWLKWRESIPDDWRRGITAQRAVLLRAMAE